MATSESIDVENPQPDVIDRAVSIILSGGIVAFPTETFYGLAVDPFNPRAIGDLFEAKGRASNYALPLIAADLDQVERIVARFPPLGRRLAQRFWPGPLTLVMPAADRLPVALHAGRGTVAVRVSDHPVALALAAAAGRPLTSTSANRSAEAPARRAEDVAAALGPQVDLILDGGPTLGTAPSTIVDVCGPTASLVREGAVPWDRVLESLQ